MAFTENISEFFDSDDFATAATYGASTVYGIFDNEYADDLGGTVGVEGSNPTFTCAAADVAGIKDGDAITINATSYKVAGPPQPDGTGLITLQLQDQS